MFLDALGAPSLCAAGGEHAAQGFEFVLPFGNQEPEPTGGLGSAANYFLHCFCNPIKSLAIFVDVTEDIVCTDDFGWSIQLNCYSTQDQLCAWQQYVIGVYNVIPPETQAYAPPPVTYIIASINNWTTTNTILIDRGSQMAVAPQFGRIPAGYRFAITLSTDANDTVVGIASDFIDNKGNRVGTVPTQLLQIPGVTAADIAPIIAFQVNIVGPFNGIHADFSSGAGAITYVGTPDLNVSNKEPSCAETGVVTTETANTFYGPLPPTTHGSLTQSFNTSSVVPMIRKVGTPRPPLSNPLESLKLG